MASQDLANRVISILKDPALEKIRFVLSGLEVTNWGYEMVSHALATGKISCGVGVAPNRNLSAGFVAKCRYEPDHRRMLFPDPNFGLSPGTQTFDIVHEATHAMFDCKYGGHGGVNILAIEDEAAAFLAQAMYSHVTDRAIYWNGPIVPGPITEALKVSNKITAIPGFLDQGRPPYHVPPSELIPLRLSIQTAYRFVGGAATIQHTYYGVPW